MSTLSILFRNLCIVLAAQSHLTLCDPMNCSPPCSPVHGILQARILEGVAMSFSRGSSQTWDQTWVSCITSRFFTIWDSLVAQRVESACNAGDLISIPGLGRSPGEENSNPRQYSCLENPMDGRAWQAIVSPLDCKESNAVV